ncbi:hypothetical protein BH11PSE7_BH11PSE7_27160 [soil metagenome]
MPIPILRAAGLAAALCASLITPLDTLQQRDLYRRSIRDLKIPQVD